MGQASVKVFFSAQHTGLETELNQWLGEVSGRVLVRGISMDSNQFGHCLVVMYESAEPGRDYRAHLYFDTNHRQLERKANEGLVAAQAQWGRLVVIGSNEYGHTLCVLEEQ